MIGKPSWPTVMATVVAILALGPTAVAVMIVRSWMPFSFWATGEASGFSTPGTLFMVIAGFLVGAAILHIAAMLYKTADFKFTSYVMVFLSALLPLLYFFPRVLLSLRGLEDKVPFEIYAGASEVLTIFVPPIFGLLWAGRRLAAKYRPAETVES